MTAFEKALAWHKLGKAWSPNAASVKHVDAILEELHHVSTQNEGLRASLTVIPPHPFPELVERLRSALTFGQERRQLAVAIDLEDLQQLLAAFEPQLSAGDAKL